MLLDRFQRPLQDLRISVTDRCNFRCLYCMPLAEYDWLAQAEILSYEEIERLTRIFAGLGVSKIRITGGEPLVRRDLSKLIGKLSVIDGVTDLCLTTNGALLASRVDALKASGLRRVNVSIDTLKPERFRAITQRGELEPVIEGLMAAKQAGLGPIKLNAVIEKGVNEDEIVDLAEFARQHGFAMRFIEYMDVGNANHWRSDRLVSKQEILRVIGERYPLRPARGERGRAPADSYEFEDGGGEIGVIASVSEPFCGSCSRMRLTANGQLVTCLFAARGHDLKAMLRAGASDQEVSGAIRSVWTVREDRYSEQRLALLQSEAGYQPENHKKIEMIRLGG